jgi:hypothetical protein
MNEKYQINLKLLVRTMFVLFVIFLPWQVYASNQTILFGGGPNPEYSQISIYKNTHWIEDILNRRYPKNKIHLFYDDANADGVDVRNETSTKKDDIFQALSNIFEPGENIHFISSHFDGDINKSDSDTVSKSIEKVFAQSKSGDNILLIFQGHGGYNKTNTNKNYLKLWNDTGINVTELEKLMDKANPEANVRFVLPQCFSGAFTRVIYNNANIKDGVADGRRCGFLAQRENKGAEGCTDSVNTGDYRDYATYFFSALDNKTINGKKLTVNPDRNNDGVITLLEAHLYTLENADSIDISSSTSEDYLTEWNPWYIHYIPSFSEPKNVYSDVARYIANRYNIVGEGSTLIDNVKKRIKEFENSKDEKKKKSEVIKHEYKKAQDIIKKQLIMRWPYLAHPYRKGFYRTIQESGKDILKLILQNKNYPYLLKQREQLKELNKQILDIRRNKTQMEKILRFNDMAIKLEEFKKFATSEEKKNYNKLLECENYPLN